MAELSNEQNQFQQELLHVLNRISQNMEMAGVAPSLGGAEGAPTGPQPSTAQNIAGAVGGGKLGTVAKTATMARMAGAGAAGAAGAGAVAGLVLAVKELVALTTPMVKETYELVHGEPMKKTKAVVMRAAEAGIGPAETREMAEYSFRRESEIGERARVYLKEFNDQYSMVGGVRNVVSDATAATVYSFQKTGGAKSQISLNQGYHRMEGE